MRKTLNVDADLLAQAREMSHARTDTEAIHLGLRQLVTHIASQEIRKLGGSEPDATDTPRRRPPEFISGDECPS